MTRRQERAVAPCRPQITNMPEVVSTPIADVEAERILNQARLLDISDYNAASQELRSVAFAAAALRNGTTLAHVRGWIARAVREGWSLAEFQEYLEVTGLAWEARYAETVFRNNVQGAYNRARWVAMNKGPVTRAFPALMYDGIADTRQTDFCRRHDGRWWWREEFPSYLYPANHHMCRSIVRPITKQRAISQGEDHRGTDSSAEFPDAAWRGNSGELWASNVAARRRAMESLL